MADNDTNDDQAKALIEAIAPKLAEAILPQITESVETQIKGLKEKNDELLDKLAKSKAGDDARDTADAQLKTLLGRGDKPEDIKDVLTPAPIKLTREQARDRQVYLRAKAQSDRTGAPLEIV